MAVNNTTPPTLSGTAQQGRTLTTTDGTWTFDEDFLTYEYQWRRCDSLGANCVDIAGATTNQYTLAAADIGGTVRSRVTATEHTTTPGDAWATMLDAEFPLASFTATRTVNVTSKAQLDAACSDLQAGDKIVATSPFTYSGSFQGLRSKRMSNWCELHLDGVHFTGINDGYVFVMIDTRKVRVYGPEISGQSAFTAVPIYGSIDVEFRGTVHDTDGTGVHLVPYGNVAPTRCVVVVECYNNGLDYSLDPHAEPGTGLHALYAGKSGDLPASGCKYAVDTHDQDNCAGGLQFTNHQNSVFAVRGNDLTFFATSQTAGNLIQHFGSTSTNNRMVHLEGDNIAGKGLSTIGGLGSTNVVEYGRLTNYLQNPHEGSDPWDSGPTYQDVIPAA